MLKENIIKLLGLSEDDRKPLIKWFDAFEKALNKLRGSYAKVNPTDMLELYYAGVSPEEAAKQLKESVELDERTKTRTFEFPDNRKAKQFLKDITNSAVANGTISGNRVTDVEPIGHEWETREAPKEIAKYLKKNRGKEIKESVEELDEKHPTSVKIGYSKIMKGIRDSQGPFSVVAIKNGKVVGNKHSIKYSKLLPIEVNDMAKDHPLATISIESKDGKILNTFKESVELDEEKDYKVELEKRHIKALMIIRFIDQTMGKQGKWTDSFGNYVTAKMPDDVDTSVDAGWAYHQNRGRGDWNFIIEPKDMVKYNNENMPWKPKSGTLPYNKFMELLKTVAKDDKYQKESVELDEKSFRDFDVPASPEIKKWIESGRARILMSTDSTLGGNSQFVIIENPNFRNAKISGEDKVLMFTISDPKRGRIKMFSFHGSHVNVKGAMKFAKNNKLVTGWIHNLESVERTFRRWEESVEEEPCTTHKRCDKKNKKSLLVNPLRGYPQNETEEEVKESSDAAGNNVGGGEVAGIAPGEDPPVTKKRKKFAGCDVFEVSPDVYYKCVQGKKKFEHWKRYFDRESGDGSEIYEFAYKYPRKAIIVQNKITQEMVYLRHNRK